MQHGRLELPVTVQVSFGGWPALVLNADFRPLSYYPLSLWGWQDAIKAVFLDRVNIVLVTSKDDWFYLFSLLGEEPHMAPANTMATRLAEALTAPR